MKQNILKFLVIAFLFNIAQISALPFAKKEAFFNICDGYSWELFVEKYSEYIAKLNEFSNAGRQKFEKIIFSASELENIDKFKKEISELESLREELIVVLGFIKEDLKIDKNNPKIIELLSNNAIFNDQFHRSLEDAYETLRVVAIEMPLLRQTKTALDKLEKGVIEMKQSKNIKEFAYCYDTLNKAYRKEINLSFKSVEELYWQAKSLIKGFTIISNSTLQKYMIFEIAKIGNKLEFSEVLSWLESRLDSLFNENEVARQSANQKPKEVQKPTFLQKMYASKGKIAALALAVYLWN